MQVKNANKEKPGVTTTTSPHTKKKKRVSLLLVLHRVIVTYKLSNVSITKFQP